MAIQIGATQAKAKLLSLLDDVEAEPERLSWTAEKAVEEADDLAISGISLCELGMARRQRIGVATSIGAWLQELAARFRTMPITAAIAATAAALPDSFPRDPADRLIYATAN